MFESRAVNIKFLVFETHNGPFDSDSDSDPDSDQIPLRQQIFGRGIDIVVGERDSSRCVQVRIPVTGASFQSCRDTGELAYWRGPV